MQLFCSFPVISFVSIIQKGKNMEFEKLQEIIADVLNVPAENITPETRFVEDLGADSLDIVELIMALEEEFNTEIPDSDAEKIVTVGDVVDYIKEHLDAE